MHRPETAFRRECYHAGCRHMHAVEPDATTARVYACVQRLDAAITDYITMISIIISSCGHLSGSSYTYRIGTLG